MEQKTLNETSVVTADQEVVLSPATIQKLARLDSIFKKNEHEVHNALLKSVVAAYLIGNTR